MAPPMVLGLVLLMLCQVSHADTIDLALRARQGGDLPLAASILSRINENKPNSLRVQLELARVYFEQGKYDSAKLLLDTVLAAPLPEPVRENAESFQQLLDERITDSGQPVWQHSLALGIGRSDRFNVLSGVEQDGSSSVNPFDDDQFDRDRDDFAQLSWRGGRRPNEASSGWLFDGYVRERDYADIDAADSRWAQLRGGWRFAIGQNNFVDASVVGRQLSVDGETSFESIGAGLGWHIGYWAYPLSISTEWSDRRYQENRGADPRDGERTQFRVTQAGWAGDDRWRWHWGVSYQEYAAAAERFDYDILETLVALSYRFTPNWRARFETSHSDIHFLRPEVFELPPADFGPTPPPGFVVRHSDRWQVRLAAERRLTSNWLAELGVTGFVYSNEELTNERTQTEAFAKLTWVMR